MKLCTGKECVPIDCLLRFGAANMPVLSVCPSGLPRRLLSASVGGSFVVGLGGCAGRIPDRVPGQVCFGVYRRVRVLCFTHGAVRVGRRMLQQDCSTAWCHWPEWRSFTRLGTRTKEFNVCASVLVIETTNAY